VSAAIHASAGFLALKVIRQRQQNEFLLCRLDGGFNKDASRNGPGPEGASANGIVQIASRGRPPWPRAPRQQRSWPGGLVRRGLPPEALQGNGCLQANLGVRVAQRHDQALYDFGVNYLRKVPPWRSKSPSTRAACARTKGLDRQGAWVCRRVLAPRPPGWRSTV